MTEVSDRPALGQASTRPTLDVLPPCPSWCEANHDRQFGPDREPLAWTLACSAGRKAWDLTHRRVVGTGSRAVQVFEWSAIACDGVVVAREPATMSWRDGDVASPMAALELAKNLLAATMLLGEEKGRPLLP